MNNYRVPTTKRNRSYAVGQILRQKTINDCHLEIALNSKSLQRSLDKTTIPKQLNLHLQGTLRIIVGRDKKEMTDRSSANKKGNRLNVKRQSAKSYFSVNKSNPNKHPTTAKSRNNIKNADLNSKSTANIKVKVYSIIEQHIFIT